MSFDIGALKTALATKISDAYTAAGFACNVYDYAPVDPITPCVIIDTGETTYYETFRSTGVASMALTVEFRSSAGGAREIDCLKECDAVIGTGTGKSLFDAVVANDYALTGVTGWAVVLSRASAPVLRQAADGSREWYTVTFTANCAHMKG